MEGVALKNDCKAISAHGDDHLHVVDLDVVAESDTTNRGHADRNVPHGAHSFETAFAFVLTNTWALTLAFKFIISTHTNRSDVSVMVTLINKAMLRAAHRRRSQRSEWMMESYARAINNLGYGSSWARSAHNRPRSDSNMSIQRSRRETRRRGRSISYRP